MIEQDDINIPVPQPGVPDETDALNFGQKIADFITDNPRVVAALIMTAIVMTAWKVKQIRLLMIVVATLFAGAWLGAEGVIG